MKANRTQAHVPGSFMRCEFCGKKDESVKKIGHTLCSVCDKELSKSMDAVDKYRRKYPEFDGGGGA